tara:strand:+ start:346 stop:1221 length:876 start_codon:yes stop_codon:yes gene_type:complete
MFEHIADKLLNLKQEEYIQNKSQIVPQLKEYLLDSLKSIQDEKIGIAFSGGLDSSLLALLAQKTGKKFMLYSVGLQKSPDLEYAGRLALQMNWPLKIKILSEQQAEEILINTAQILSDSTAEINTVNIGVGSVIYSVLQMARKDGIKTVIGGLGAEEIFAGYKRHVNYGKDYSKESIQKALFEGLKGLETRDLARDLPIANYFGIKILSPFLTEDIVSYSMKIHPELKINSSQKKIILRETAIHLGLPEEFALRKKLACQYGSKFDKFIEKLAKRKNLSSKKELLKNLTNL